MEKLPRWAEFLMSWTLEYERRRTLQSEPAGEATPASVATTFLFEVIERGNDRLLDQIDGLDALFAVILTGVLAVILLAIDRFRLIGMYWDVFIGWLAVVLLAVAFFHCVRGIWKGNELRRRADAHDEGRDVPDPGRLVLGVARTGERAIMSAMHDIVRNRPKNIAVRNYKRRALSLALVFLTVGTVAAGTAKVVYSSYDAGESRAASPRAADRGRGKDSGRTDQHAGFLYLQP